MRTECKVPTVAHWLTVDKPMFKHGTNCADWPTEHEILPCSNFSPQGITTNLKQWSTAYLLHCCNKKSRKAMYTSSFDRPACCDHCLQIWSCPYMKSIYHNQGLGTPGGEYSKNLHIKTKWSWQTPKLSQITNGLCTQQNCMLQGLENLDSRLERKFKLTSQTPQRCLLTPPSLLFCSICSAKKASKIWYTSFVVVAFVGPLMSFSIFVGWRIACLRAARLEKGGKMEPH